MVRKKLIGGEQRTQDLIDAYPKILKGAEQSFSLESLRESFANYNERAVSIEQNSLMCALPNYPLSGEGK